MSSTNDEFSYVCAGECPICGADISEDEMLLPCWDCGALPPN